MRPAAGLAIATLGVLAVLGPGHAAGEGGVKVLRAYVSGVSGGPDAAKKPARARLGDRISIETEGLSTWVAGTGGRPNDPSLITLVADGRPLEGLVPRLVGRELLQFDLVYDAGPTTRAEWVRLFQQKGWTREVSVTLRLPGDPVPLSTAGSLELVVIPQLWFCVWTGLFVLLAVAFVLLAWKSDLLRDAGPAPRPGPVPAQSPNKALSLARCQMAFWFFVIVACHLFIGMVTGNWDNLTTQAAMLIGISAATGVAARAVDANKRTASESQRGAAVAEETTLQAKATTLVEEMAAINRKLQGTPSPTAVEGETLRQEYARKQIEQNTVLNRLNEIVGLVRKTEAALVSPPSEGPMLDLLSDASGVALHRFQMAAWTLILGIVFATSAYRNLAMQEISEPLLLLMGISGGTYVGFKIPERTG